jgi:hypothetical protein
VFPSRFIASGANPVPKIYRPILIAADALQCKPAQRMF